MATRTRNKKGQFVKGHKKIGGRKKASRKGTKRYREGAASFIKWNSPAGTKGRKSSFGGKRARTKAGRRGHAASSSRKGAGKLKVGQSKTIHAKKTHKTYKITRVK